MINIILIILILFITSCNAPVDFKNPVKEQTPVIANDISNQKITAFAEDEHGHIWIGTFRGLNKYDGNEFYQYFSTDDSLDLADNNINDLMLDSKKRLWVWKRIAIPNLVLDEAGDTSHTAGELTFYEMTLLAKVTTLEVDGVVRGVSLIELTNNPAMILPGS